MFKHVLIALTSTVLLLIPSFSQAQETNAQVTGTVAYRERMALPPDAVIDVQLLDTSIADVAGQTVAGVLINAEGRQVPVPFTLTYDPAKIVPGNRYSVRATIRSGDGMLMFSSTQAYPVLTHGAPSKANLLLHTVGHGAHPGAAPKKQGAASENTASAPQASPPASREATPAVTTATPPSQEPEKPAAPAEAKPAETEAAAAPPSSKPQESATAPATPPMESAATPRSESTPRETAPPAAESGSRPPAPASAPPVQENAPPIPPTTEQSPSAQTPATSSGTNPEPPAQPESKAAAEAPPATSEPTAPTAEAKAAEPEAPLPEAPSASKQAELEAMAPESAEPAPESTSRPEKPAANKALTPLADTQWKLVQLNGQTVDIAPPQKPVTLAFSPEGRRIAGSAGCNSYLGTFTDDHGRLHLSPGSMTMMACADPAGSRERKFVAMLRSADGYKISGGFLLLTSNGKTVAKFTNNQF